MNNRPSRGADRLAAIFDALPDGLVLVNSNGTIVNANTMALGMFEMPGTVLVGRGLFDLLPDFDPRLLPGSMPLPGDAGGQGRTAPARMVARRADGNEFAAEVTGVHLDDRRETPDPYDSHSDDRLLLLVVRDLAGTLDTEAELGRSQRQLEMILRAASEGVVGTDTEGRVVLVNPAAAQILGYRAGQLGGQQLHPLILHSRADGEPFPYEESPLCDTLGSGRKHRVREQVLWAQDGERIPVDITTAPVRDGSQLVGAVMTFTDQRPYEQLAQKHEAQLADLTERHSTELDRHEERYAALDARHAQLEAVLDGALHGSLERLRTELGTLAADDAFHLWPEASQLLQHLSAGYARMTALVNNVLGYQRLDAGADGLRRKAVLLDRVVDDGIDGAVELIGPGGSGSPWTHRRSRRRSTRNGSRPRSPTSSRTWRAPTMTWAPGVSTRQSSSWQHSGATPYGSRSAGRTSAAILCISPLCGGSSPRTAVWCGRARCGRRAGPRTSSKCPSWRAGEAPPRSLPRMPGTPCPIRGPPRRSRTPVAAAVDVPGALPWTWSRAARRLLRAADPDRPAAAGGAPPKASW